MTGPRVAVLGAGSIGCFVGGAWQAAGIATRFVGRPRIANDIRGKGLKLTDFAGWSADLPPAEVDYGISAELLADADIIALCVKSGATAQAAEEIARHGREGAIVASFQNGVSNVDTLEEVLGGKFDVVRGMVPFNVAYLGEGRFHKGVAGDLWVEDRPALRRLAELVEGGPAALHLSADMVAVAWGKLIINLNNAVNALSGRPLLEQLRRRDYRRATAASQREGLALLKAAGIRPAKVGAVGPALLPTVIGSPDWLFNSLFLKGWKIDSKARSSMADDLAAGRKTEVDFLNGELVRLAESLGRDAPVNRKIVELVRRAEGGAGPWTGPALLRELPGAAR